MEPLQEGDERRLAAPARPDERHRFARAHLEIDPSEHGRARLIREADLPELHLASERGDLPGIRLVADRVLDVQNAVDAFERYRRAAEGLVAVGDALDRPEQPADVAEESDQGAEPDLTLKHEIPAKRERREPSRRGPETAERSIPRVRPDAAPNHLVPLPDAVEEALLLGLLHIEDLHRHHPGQDLVEPAVDGAPPLDESALALDLLGGGPGADEGRERRERDDRGRETPVQSVHRQDREHQVQGGGQQIEREIAERRDIPVDALVHAVDRATHGLPLVIGQWQAVQLADHPLAHRVLDTEPHVPAHHAEPPLDRRADQLEDDQEDHGNGERRGPRSVGSAGR